MATTYTKTVGRLATDRYSFQDHLTGASFRHTASQIDLSPALNIDGYNATNVQSAISHVSSYIALASTYGQGFITIGDGYNCCLPDGTYNSLIPNLNIALNDLLNNTSNPLNSRISGGGIVLIKAGTYKFDAPVNVPAGIKIIGEGFGTKLINNTNNNSIFIIKRDANRANLDGILSSDSSDFFMFARETVIYNLVISDNFIMPKFLGDTSYKIPNNTSTTSCLVSVESDASLTCEKVYFIGRALFSGTVTSCSSFAVDVDNTTPSVNGTYLTIENCFIDGFSIATRFITSSFDAEKSYKDYFIFRNNKTRILGYLSATSGDPSNNTAIIMNACNADISNNYFYGHNYGFASNILYFFLIPSTLVGNKLPLVKVSNNTGVFNKNNITSGNILLFYTRSVFNSTNFKLDIHDNFINDDLSQDQNRFLLTIGDGQSTFGDFNGNSAIADAISILKLQPSLQSLVKIFLKSGGYDVSNYPIVFDQSFDLEIEGQSTASVFIAALNSDAIAPLTTNSNIHNDKLLKIKNLSFMSFYVTRNPININNTGTLFENVNFFGINIIFKGGTNNYGENAAQFNNCSFLTSPIYIEVDGVIKYKKYIYETCYFYNTAEQSLFTIKAASSYIYGTSISEIPGLSINNSDIHTGPTSVYSGNFVNSNGILELNNNLLESGTGVIPLFTVNDFTVSNSTISSSLGGSLINCLPSQVNYSYGDSGDYIHLDNVNLLKNKFYFENSTTYTLSPFILFLNLYSAGKQSKILIDSCLFKYNNDYSLKQYSNGTRSNDVNNYWNGDPNWGLINLQADVINIINTNIENMPSFAGSGELNINSPHININGLFVNNYFQSYSTSTAPLSRLFINGGGVLKNIELIGFRSTETTPRGEIDWVYTDVGTPINYGIIIIRSDIHDYLINKSPFSFENIKISNFTYNVSSVQTETRCGIAFSRNNSSSYDYSEIIFDKINIKNTKYGIAYSNNHLSSRLKLLTIRDSVISTTSDCLHFNYTADSPTQKMGNINAHSCRLSSSTGYGIYVLSDNWAYSPTVCFSNNLIDAGSGMIYIKDSGSATPDSIIGTIFGNMLAGSGVSNIYILCTGATADGAYTISSFPIRGCEVSYPGSTNTRTFTNTTTMLHNSATLKIR